MTEIEQLNMRIGQLEKLLDVLIRSDRYTISKTMQFLDGRHIQVAKGYGTKIGTEGGATGQKLGFFGATPVIQQLKANHNNWAAFGDVVSGLVNLGLFDQT